MGMRAKESVRARNAVLVLGCLVLIVGDLCYAYMPSALGERGQGGGPHAPGHYMHAKFDACLPSLEGSRILNEARLYCSAWLPISFHCFLSVCVLILHAPVMACILLLFGPASKLTRRWS